MTKLDIFIQNSEKNINSIKLEYERKIKNIETKLKIISKLKEKYPDLDFSDFNINGYRSGMKYESNLVIPNCKKIEFEISWSGQIHLSISLREKVILNDKQHFVKIYPKPSTIYLTTAKSNHSKSYFVSNIDEIIEYINKNTKIKKIFKKEFVNFITNKVIINRIDVSTLPQSIRKLITFI